MITKLSPKNTWTKRLSLVLCVIIFLCTATLTLTLMPKKAQAACCSCCLCSEATFQTDFVEWIQTWLEINIYIFFRLQIHQQIWMDAVFWQVYALPSLMQMGVQMSAIGAYQVMAIGMFIDAKEQLEAQRMLQEMHARAHKDYQTSTGMCEFGTRIKSLAASERQAEINASIMSQRSTDRLLASQGSQTYNGVRTEITTRLNKLKNTYCDISNNNGNLADFCPQMANFSSGSTAEERDRFNADIDYQKTIQDPLTIDFDLITNEPPSSADEDIISMADNLYGFEGFDIANYENLQNNPNEDVSSTQQAYLDLRGVVAKTKVAENSYNALVSMKSKGTAGSRDFMRAFLEELGMPAPEIEQFLGENPSYYAQMEILTKKAYQTPMFYTNLYDKPANVERKGVALQAIGLIQKFDLLKSYLRTEASLSVLLELSVQQIQRQVEDNILAFDQGRTISR